MPPLLVLIVVGALGVGQLAAAQSDGRLDAAALQSALDEFKIALDERWSYRHANRADFDAAIAALRQKAGAGMSIDELGLELHKILALGIDAHSGVDGYRLPGARYLPFLIEPAGERWIAFKTDRTGFLIDGFPYLAQIDGRDVGEWCDAAAALVPKGSPPYLRHRCLAVMRNLEFVRGLLKLPQRDSVEVRLISRDGNTQEAGASCVERFAGVWKVASRRVAGVGGKRRVSAPSNDGQGHVRLGD